jgi:hypothetical protein
MSSSDSRHARVFRGLAHVTVFAVVSGIVSCIAYARWRTDAIERVRKSHGRIYFASLPTFVPQSLPVPEWVQRIESVTLQTNDTTDDDLRSFAGFPLTEISPYKPSFGTSASRGFSDVGLQRLAGLPLERLDLRRTSVTGEGFVHLRQCSSLYYVSIEDSLFNDAGLAALSRIPSLENVELHGTRITDAGLAELRALPNLKHLDLSTTAITDDGLRQLAELKLETLNLDCCTRVTDAGLQHLARMPLRELRICCTHVTPKGLRTLLAMKTLEDVVVFIRDEYLEDLRAEGLKVRVPSGTSRRRICSEGSAT